MPIARNATLDACLQSVAERAPQAMARCIDQIMAALAHEEAQCVQSARRYDLAEARLELAANKQTWCRQYQAELIEAFRSIIEQRTRAGVSVRIEATGSAGGLSLVDDTQVSQAIETSRLIEHVMTDLEQPVSELDALVSSALGMDNVRSDFNPLRPDSFAHSFRKVVEHTPSDGARRAMWMQRLAGPLSAELVQIYAGVTRQLKSAGVQPARYGRAASQPRMAPGGQASPSVPATGGGFAADAQPLGAHVVRSAEQIHSQLLHHFLANDSTFESAALPAEYYAQVNAEIAEILNQPRRYQAAVEAADDYRAMAPVDRVPRSLDVQSALSEQLWGEYADPRQRSLVRGHLRREAKDVGQVFGLEIVRRVIGEVAQDPRLLTPVREAIIASEPVLLRVAMTDPRFLKDGEHPGRQLIEQIARRSFKYNDEFASEFREFFEDVNAALRELNAARIESAQPVEAALDKLRASWTAQDEKEQTQRDAALRALRFAEQRQEQAAAIAAQLGQRLSLPEVPDLVRQFLVGPWALVLAHQRLTTAGDRPDPNGYWAAIDDLLWSVDRTQTLHHPGRMFELVPPLVAKLRDGLASIDSPAEEHERFFNGLMRLHQPVLKLRAKSRRSAHDVSQLLDEMPTESVGPAMPDDTERPWMAARDLGAAGFEDTLPTDMGALVADGPSPAGEAGPAGAEGGTENAQVRARTDEAPASNPDNDMGWTIDELQQGDWVDLYSRRRWRRAQLVWAAERRTLFMFVSHGGRPHSMTRRMCEALMRTRYLRPVARDDVVARALGVLDKHGSDHAHR